ncbi:MAG: acyltransferase [Saccharofermentans sp.]|nr:acyltransferase [Saccharofermentans sp.]
MTKTEGRKSNIELLRILTMLGVVILHYNNQDIGGGLTYVPQGSINEVIMYFLECLFIGAVDTFILITGYFLAGKRKSGIFKPVCLLIQVMFFKIILYIVDLATGYQSFNVRDMVSSLLPRYWFFNVYIALFLIFPLINLLIDKLDSKGHKILLILSFVLFSVQPVLADSLTESFGSVIEGMSFFGAGINDGYNIVQFILMFIIGVLIRKHEESLAKYSTTVFVLVFVLCCGINTLWSYFQETSLHYSNPLVVIGSPSVFIAFSRLKIKSGRVINSLAKASFAVYLTNFYLFRYFNIAEVVKGNTVIYILHTIGVAVAVYLASWILYMVFDLISRPLFEVMKKKIRFWEYEI